LYLCTTRSFVIMMSRRDAFSSHVYRRNASLESAAFITGSSEDLSLDVRRSLKIDGRRYERKKNCAGSAHWQIDTNGAGRDRISCAFVSSHQIYSSRGVILRFVCVHTYTHVSGDLANLYQDNVSIYASLSYHWWCVYSWRYY